MSGPQPGDKSAGFTGLILGGITIFVIVFAIVRLTSAYYQAKHGAGGETPAAVGAPAH